MNKKTSLLIAFLFLIAVLLIIVKIKGSRLKQESPEESQTAVKTVSEAAEMALAIKSGKPLKCKLTKGEDYMDYYVESGKMRVDGYTTTSSDGKPLAQVSHMINDGEYMYIWTEGSGTAVKIKTPTAEDAASMQEQVKKYTSQAPQLETEDDYRTLENQGYTVSCEAASSNTRQFVPPSDLTFTDVAAMMQAIPSPATGTGMSEAQIKKLQEQYGKSDQ